MKRANVKRTSVNAALPIKDSPDEFRHRLGHVVRGVHEPAVVALVHDDADVADVAQVRKGIGHRAAHRLSARSDDLLLNGNKM